MLNSISITRKNQPDKLLVHTGNLGETAKRYFADNSLHKNIAADLLIKNKVGVIGFNGVYGLFTNADNAGAHNRILKIKDRQINKSLVLVSAPEYLTEHVDFSKSSFSHEQVIGIQKSVHALGVILPASRNAPNHLVAKNNKYSTILSIWTEYKPLRDLIEKFRKMGGRALAGTSANKSGQPTHFDSKAVFADFKHDVDFTFEANYSKFPEIRKRSTSIIDLTGIRPQIFRLGNITREEIQEALLKFKFPELLENDKIVLVNPKKSYTNHASMSANTTLLT